MPRKTHKPEEIVGILRDIEIKQGQGQSIADSCREKGISEAIFPRRSLALSGRMANELPMEEAVWRDASIGSKTAKGTGKRKQPPEETTSGNDVG